MNKHFHPEVSREDVAFINVACVRLKFLWIFGVDYSYDMSRDAELQTHPEEGDLHYRAKLRLSGLLYPLPLGHFNFYFIGGTGAAHLSEAFLIAAPGESYHGGIGFEVFFDDHVALDLSFVLVAPGVHTAAERALHAGEIPRLNSLFGLKNHEFVLRFLFFL